MARLRPIGHADRLSLVDHLDELRTRLIYCVVALVVAFSVCYSQNDRILNTVNGPLENTQNLAGDAEGSQDPFEQNATFQVRIGAAMAGLASALAVVDRSLERMGDERGLSTAARSTLERDRRDLRRAAASVQAAARATPRNRERQPITLGVTEPFVTTFTVAGYAALLLTLPFLLYQAYAFVLPAFSPSERRVALPMMAMVPVLFLAGVAFGWFFALPPAIKFLQNFNDDSFDILVQAKDYYRFAIVFLAVMGFLFQIPVGVLAVTRLGVISARQLKRNRGYVLLGIAVLAAVATPTPDPFTMVISMAPLVVLFELSVQLAALFERRRERRAEEEGEDGSGGGWSAWGDWDDDDDTPPAGSIDPDELDLSELELDRLKSDPPDDDDVPPRAAGDDAQRSADAEPGERGESDGDPPVRPAVS